jgi:hypothetical protein
MPKLENLVGSIITAVIPNMQRDDEPDHFQDFKLHGVEPGSGIWIESQGVTNEALEYAGRLSAANTLVLFVPFHHVKMIVESVPVPSLSEREFGK